jgi:prepilin-type processing-associated H-X9-DG protein
MSLQPPPEKEEWAQRNPSIGGLPMTKFPAAAPPPSPAPPRTSGLAVASLVCGILGLCVPVIGGLVGLVLGIIGLVKVNRSAGALAGGGLAVAGIVVSAIGVLFWLIAGGMALSLLIPAIHSAHDEYEAQAFMNHARQLGTAALASSADNKGEFPPPEEWPEVLMKNGYLANDQVLCDPREPHAGRAFAMNANLAGMKLGSVPNATRTVLFFECRPGAPPCGGPELMPAKPRHRGTFVICFLDGHVDRVRRDEVERLIWNPKPEPPTN